MRRMYSKEQLQKLIDEVSRLIAIEELEKVVPVPSLATAGYIMRVNEAGTGYELVEASPISVDGQTIRPANVYCTGDITGNSIIENMSGYSLAIGTPTNATLTPVYGSLCKNGNKLTFVFAANIKRTGAMGVDTLCTLTIPSSIGSKINVSVGSSTVLRGKAYCVDIDGAINDDKDSVCAILKISNTTFTLTIYNADELEANKDYYFRFECTFLLSDNLLA